MARPEKRKARKDYPNEGIEVPAATVADVVSRHFAPLIERKT